MKGDVDFEIWIEDRERDLLGDLVPGMELLPSVPTPDQIGRPLHGYLHTHDRLSQVSARLVAGHPIRTSTGPLEPCTCFCSEHLERIAATAS
jgi:hypothetical protein